MSSKTKLWIGRVMTGVAVLFMVMDAISHILNVAPVMEAMTQLGYPAHITPILGIIVLVCLVLYLYPRTAVLGAILLTGYLGGAVASNVRIEAPLFTNVLFPVYLGAMFWGGLYLRDKNIADLIPLKKVIK